MYYVVEKIVSVEWVTFLLLIWFSSMKQLCPGNTHLFVANELLFNWHLLPFQVLGVGWDCGFKTYWLYV